jgi:hypothetical protein
MVGLGRMGSNMVRRLQRGGHQCVAFDPDERARKVLIEEGALPVPDLRALVAVLPPPRTVWMMAPAGGPTDTTIRELSALLSRRASCACARTHSRAFFALSLPTGECVRRSPPVRDALQVRRTHQRFEIGRVTCDPLRVCGRMRVVRWSSN